MAYLEDLEVGAKHRFGRYEVTREEIIDFASKYDPQPFHLSDEGAANSHFRTLAASGWHTTAMMMAMNVAAMGDDSGSLGAAGVDELRWLRPVRPGDVLHCESEVLSVKPSATHPDRGSAKIKTTVFDQNDQPVMTAIASTMHRRRPA